MALPTALPQKDKGAAGPAQVAVTVDLDSSEGSKQGSVARMASMTVKHNKWFDSEHWTILRARPRILLISAAVLVILLVPSVVGVVYAAQASVESAKQLAYNGPCLQLASGIRQKLYSIFWGVKALVSYIRMNPSCSVLNRTFTGIAQDIKTWDMDDSIRQLEADPVSIVTYLEPPASGSKDFLEWLYGYNMLTEPGNAWRGSAPLTSPGHLLFSGPYQQPDEPTFFGGYVVYGIYLPAESYEQDVGCNAWLGEPYNCSGCWDPVRKLKFWGFVQGLIDLDQLVNGTDPVLTMVADTYRWDLHMDYNLPPDDHNYKFLQRNNSGRIGRSNPPPVDPVKRDILIENIHWVIEISPINGWAPSWFGGCLAAVVIGSILIAMLVLWLLLTMEMQVMSNKRLAHTNQALAESNHQLGETTRTLEKEKLASDELVKRQLKLIACLEVPSDGAGLNGSFVNDVDGKIEAMRRALNSQNQRSRSSNAESHSSDDGEIKVLELLGEGTFGKVYKGIWHGTCVAVKSILLPANMSGQAKREKMVVMEAAISSSLSHPNIVQTYTYDITRHKSSDVSSGSFAGEDGVFGSNLLVDSVSTHHALGVINKARTSLDSKSAMPSVHSYEVRIVLEFCDSGSLREALDNNIFMQNDIFNYLAVLDTVLDISRAILHLHKANVLHGDLKTVNVLLKSAGGEGRGFVAKVADFGLSVQIDKAQTHMSNVFQGTMTHMSPELLLMGQASRQADIYAFGITMWEVVTAGRPFKGMPLISLGHNIAVQGMRPQWPIAVPLRYRMLAERCWAHAPEERPTMDAVVAQLTEMRAEAGGSTPCVDMSYHQDQLRNKHEEAMRRKEAALQGLTTTTAGSNSRVRSSSSVSVGAGLVMQCLDSDLGASFVSQVSGAFRMGSRLEEVPEGVAEGQEGEDGDEGTHDAQQN